MSTERTKKTIDSYQRKLGIIKEREKVEGARLALQREQEEERLEATGVVQLFKDLRDEGTFTLGNKSDEVITRNVFRKKEKVWVPVPAIVRLGGPLVEFIFDRRRDTESVVSAYFEGNRLYVEGVHRNFVGDNDPDLLKTIVGEALAEPKIRKIEKKQS